MTLKTNEEWMAEAALAGLRAEVNRLYWIIAGTWAAVVVAVVAAVAK